MNFTYQHYALAYILEEERLDLFQTLKKEWFDNDLKSYYDCIENVVKTRSMLPSRSMFDSVGLILPQFSDIGMRFDEIIDVIKLKRLENWRNDFTDKFKTSADISEMYALLQQASNDLTSLTENDEEIFIDVVSVMEDIYLQSKYQTGKNKRVYVGYPTIDKKLGGLGDNDVVVIVGRMKQGKTYYLSSMAMNAVLNGSKLLYINYEMSNAEITERLLAMLTRIQEKSYSMRALSTDELERLDYFIKNFSREFKDRFLFVGKNGHVKPKDLMAYCQKTRPDLTCLDSPYMLKTGNFKDRHSQIIDTMTELKNINTSLSIPSIMTFQLNREYKDKEKGKEIKKATTYDIAEADFIARVASSVIAIRKDDTNDDIRHLDLIAGRKSGELSMKCNYDFRNFDFSEIDEKEEYLDVNSYHMEGLF